MPIPFIPVHCQKLSSLIVLTLFFGFNFFSTTAAAEYQPGVVKLDNGCTGFIPKLEISETSKVLVFTSGHCIGMTSPYVTF
jgi:hypothetical protein